MTEPIDPPDPARVIREVRGLIELPRLLLRFPSLAVQPRGHGQPIMILPGYRARGWGLGRNVGNATELMPRILKRIASFARRANQKVHLIGWSFGGYLARELARERGDLVGQVITLGTPVIGGPKYTVVAAAFRRRGIDIEAIAAEVEARNQISFTAPVIAIYSRCDCVVAWRACIDTEARNVEHIEVHTTHLGLGFSPEVYKIIAQRLAVERVVDPCPIERELRPWRLFGLSRPSKR